MDTITAVALAAIVTQNQVPLKAAPNEASAQHAVLTQGDLLEIRGRKLDYVQVYDHRRERAGYVLAAKLRATSLAADDAASLAHVLSFVRDQPGQEALTVSVAHAHLKATAESKNAASVQAETLVTLGEAAQRLVERVQRSKSANDLAHAQLDAVRFLGVKTLNVERNGEQGLCYAGDAFAQALRSVATAPTHARAALGLTRNDCIPSDLRASERRALDEARLATINKIEIENAALSELTKNQLRVREANIRASLAYSDAKLEKPNSPHAARAIALLTAVNKAELNDEAREDYHDAAVRVGVVRWGAIPQTATHERAGVRVSVSAGEPGQTCVNVRDAKGAEGKRCTYAQVWVNSLAIAPQGNVATLAVQSSATWRELWVMRKEGASWAIDVLPPSTNLQDVGLVEFAGFAGNQLLIARETIDKGRVKTSFEKISVTSLNTELKASTPTLIAAFARSQDPMWKAQTLTLR